MKKLSKLTLRQLDVDELGKRQEGLLFGGGTPGACKCGSCSSTGGTPSTKANLDANSAQGYYITGNNEPWCHCASEDKYSVARW